MTRASLIAASLVALLNASCATRPVTTPRAVDASTLRNGAETFDRLCAACHAPGRAHPGTLQLEMDRGKDRAYLLARRDIVPDYVKFVVRNGYRSMPPFRSTEVGDVELERLAAYVSSTPHPSGVTP